MDNTDNQAQLNLTLNNISDAVKVMDFIADQSCFKGWNNIRQILALRDQMDAFVTAAEKKAEANQKPETNQGRLGL